MPIRKDNTLKKHIISIPQKPYKKRASVRDDSPHGVGKPIFGSDVSLMRTANSSIIADGIPTRELIVLVSSIVVCSILPSSMIFCTSTYGSWGDLFVKVVRQQDATRAQAKGVTSPQPSISQSAPETTREVFIKASSIYWGDVSDLTKPEVFYTHRIRLTSSKQPKVVTGGEALKEIKDDLRQALRKFEKQNNVKVVWDATRQSCPDVTAAFIDFFDKEYQHADSNISPLAASLREEQ